MNELINELYRVELCILCRGELNRDGICEGCMEEAYDE